jgi:CRISPR locus-related DNA-binding protein
LEKNLRVHIAPVGFDPAERITAPLIEHRADKVYLVSKGKDDHAADRRKEIRKILDKHPHVSVKEVYVNIWDLFSAVEEYRKIFDSEKANHVHVNVSTGSKIISIAGMISCMLWSGIPYYTKLDYEDGGASVSSDKRKVKDTDFLPVYQIAKPSSELMQVLSIIDKNGGMITKKALIEELQEMKLIPVYAPSQPKSAPHSRLRALLDPLVTQWRFVSVKSKGRRSEVSLEEQGKNALRIFGLR